MTCAMVTFPQGVTEVGRDVTVELDVAGDTAGIYNNILHAVHVYPLYLTSRHVKIFLLSQMILKISMLLPQLM